MSDESNREKLRRLAAEIKDSEGKLKELDKEVEDLKERDKKKSGDST